VNWLTANCVGQIIAHSGSRTGSNPTADSARGSVAWRPVLFNLCHSALGRARSHRREGACLGSAHPTVMAPRFVRTPWWAALRRWGVNYESLARPSMRFVQSSETIVHARSVPLAARPSDHVVCRLVRACTLRVHRPRSRSVCTESPNLLQVLESFPGVVPFRVPSM